MIGEEPYAAPNGGSRLATMRLVVTLRVFPRGPSILRLTGCGWPGGALAWSLR
jgi:hypothetical protein